MSEAKFEVTAQKTINLMPGNEMLVPGTFVYGEKFAKYEGLYVKRVNEQVVEEAEAKVDAPKPTEEDKKPTRRGKKNQDK